MKIQTHASVTVPAGAERAFALVTDLMHFHEYFKGSGPVPAVLRVEWQPGNGPVPGGLRNVHNSDGSVIVEELLELKAPRKHVYRLISGFKPPFSLLVTSAKGDWTLTPEGAGTRIEWLYEFELSSPFAWPMTLPIVKIFFRQAMQNCLNAMRDRLAQTQS